MFCQKCGKGEQTPESYCRACGEWLPDLSKRGRRSFGGDSPEESLKIALYLSGITTIVALVLAILLYANYLGEPDVPRLIYATAAFLLAIAGWQASNFYVGMKLRRNFVRRRAGDSDGGTNELKAAPNAALPAADTSKFVYRTPGSVTENTTELLQPILSKGEKQNR